MQILQLDLRRMYSTQNLCRSYASSFSRETGVKQPHDAVMIDSKRA
jgi:hypothetical protein